MKQEKIIEAVQALAVLIAEKLRDILEIPQQNKVLDCNCEEWFTTEQVCKKLHITKSTLYRHRNLGFITPAKYVGRKPLYNQQSIDDYLKNFIY